MDGLLKRLARRPSPAMVVALTALFVALGGTTYAATGGTFILGQANTATSQTGLTSSNAGKALQVTQQSTGTGATALGLNVPAGKAPFTVNSGTKVVNLNADKLDGLDSTAFLRTTGKAADSELLDGLDSTAFLSATGKAADADLLDGIDSSGFYAAGSKVADSDALDGHDASDFKVGCQAGYFYYGGLCWEDIDVASQTFYQAATRCGNAGGRLPSYAEILAVANSGVTIGNGGVYDDWIGDSTADGTSLYANAGSGTNMDGEAANTSTHFARCVVPPVNSLGTP